MGIGIAMDDFETRYSLLGYIKQFPPNALKIDRFETPTLLWRGGIGALKEYSSIFNRFLAPKSGQA